MKSEKETDAWAQLEYKNKPDTIKNHTQQKSANMSFLIRIFLLTTILVAAYETRSSTAIQRKADSERNVLNKMVQMVKNRLSKLREALTSYNQGSNAGEELEREDGEVDYSCMKLRRRFFGKWWWENTCKE